MKTVVVLSNHHAWTYNLRAEILKTLVDSGNRVIVAVGYGKKVENLKEIGCEFIDIALDRHGKNPFAEIKLIRKYRKVLRHIKPDVVLTYTIKPNLYGAFLCNRLGIPCIANITGLGTAVEYPGLMQRILLKVYKVAFKDIHKVFFQNNSNRDLLKNHGIVKNNYEVLPGSGVNLSKFSKLPYPTDETIEFVFISRIMKEKGIDQYLAAAKYIREKYPNTKFHICGFCEQAYERIIEEYSDKGYIINHGMIDDVRNVISHTHCTILPTYYPEGMSNVLLESAASGRPIITTDRPGCREIIDNDFNGYVVKARDSNDLIMAIEKFIALSNDEKKEMGQNSRNKVEKQFDRQIVVEKYLSAINNI